MYPYAPICTHKGEIMTKTEEMSLDKAWNLIGAACLAYKDEKVRHALMLVRADVAEKNIALQKEESNEK